MRQKRLGLLLLISALCILSVGLVEGAGVPSISFTVPASGGYLNGTAANVTVNVNVDADTNGTFAVYIYYMNNSEAWDLRNISDTKNATNYGFDLDSTQLDDTATATLNATVSYGDGDASYNITTTLDVNVDNSAPTCSFSIDLDHVRFMDGQGVTVTDASTDNVGTLTYLYILTDPDGKNKTSKTSSAPNFNLDSFDQIGDFKLDSVVTNNAGLISACSNQTILVAGSDGKLPVIQETVRTTTDIASKKNWTMIIILVSVVVLVMFSAAGYLVIQSSKKHKRRR